MPGPPDAGLTAPAPVAAGRSDAPRDGGAPGGGTPGGGGPDDAALLRATAAGDAAAFDAFVARHEAAVFRFVGVLGLDGADAEDALQETFVAAWRGAAGYRGAGAARSWLLSVARNAVRHLVRRRAGEPAAYVALDDLDALAVRAGWGAGAALSAVGADDDAARDERARTLLAEALARLPAAERSVLVLRELEGLSGEEAAAVLALSLPALKSRLHRARIHLAAVLRAAHPEGLHGDA